MPDIVLSKKNDVAPTRRYKNGINRVDTSHVEASRWDVYLGLLNDVGWRHHGPARPPWIGWLRCAADDVPPERRYEERDWRVWHLAAPHHPVETSRWDV